MTDAVAAFIRARGVTRCPAMPAADAPSIALAFPALAKPLPARKQRLLDAALRLAADYLPAGDDWLLELGAPA